MSYDPIELAYSALVECFENDMNVNVVRVYEIKQVDLRSGDYVIVFGAAEDDDFLGIGGHEYLRTITVEVVLRTGEGRQRIREMEERVRTFFRNKDNWRKLGDNVIGVLVGLRDVRASETNIWTADLDIRWQKVDVV